MPMTLGKGMLDTLLGICRHSDLGIHACAKTKMEQLAAIHHALGLKLQAGADGDLTVGTMPIGELKPFASGQLASVARSETDGAAIILLVAEDAASGLRLVTGYPASVLQEIFTGSASLGESGEIFLTDSQGFFVTQPRHTAVRRGHSGIATM